MAVGHVRVLLNEDGKWAVQSDAADSAIITYRSQGEATAAGIRMTMATDAVLTIQGLNESPTQLDFRDCDARMARDEPPTPRADWFIHSGGSHETRSRRTGGQPLGCFS